MGTAVGNMFVAGALVVRKWLVAPELRIAHHVMVWHQHQSSLEGLQLQGRCCGRGLNEKEQI
jgi:hypothetical protein